MATQTTPSHSPSLFGSLLQDGRFSASPGLGQMSHEGHRLLRPLPRFFLGWLKENRTPVKEMKSAPANWHLTDGMSPAAETGERCSSSELAKAFAAVQANNLLQRCRQACATDACIISGADRALDAANAPRNCAVSADQRPPTSAARTTNLAREPSPTSSG